MGNLLGMESEKERRRRVMIEANEILNQPITEFPPEEVMNLQRTCSKFSGAFSAFLEQQVVNQESIALTAPKGVNVTKLREEVKSERLRCKEYRTANQVREQYIKDLKNKIMRDSRRGHRGRSRSSRNKSSGGKSKTNTSLAAKLREIRDE